MEHKHQKKHDSSHRIRGVGPPRTMSGRQASPKRVQLVHGLGRIGGVGVGVGGTLRSEGRSAGRVRA